jgi:hypothetical protein
VINPDAEWEEINRMVNAGIIPSSQRVREYITSHLRENASSSVEKVLGCIAEIMRLKRTRIEARMRRYGAFDYPGIVSVVRCACRRAGENERWSAELRLKKNI